MPQYEDDRTHATLKLLEYLKRTGRIEQYVKYISLLCNDHVKSGNMTEARVCCAQT